MNDTMRSSLRRLGWGFILVLIDFQIVFFDILPDFIGYILILLALGKLGTSNGGFRHAKWLTAILSILSLSQLIGITRIDINMLTTSQLGMHIYVQGIAMLHGLLVYLIFHELYLRIKSLAKLEILNSLLFRRKLYMTVFVLQLILYPFLLNMEESFVILLLCIGVIQFVAEFLLIRILFRLYLPFDMAVR